MDIESHDSFFWVIERVGFSLCGVALAGLIIAHSPIIRHEHITEVNYKVPQALEMPKGAIESSLGYLPIGYPDFHSAAGVIAYGKIGS